MLRDKVMLVANIITMAIGFEIIRINYMLDKSPLVGIIIVALSFIDLLILNKQIIKKRKHKSRARNFKFKYVDLQKKSDHPLPKRSTKGSAGYDFFSPIDFTLKPGESLIVDTNVCWEAGSRNQVLLIMPRSGLGFKYQCSLANTVGVIDSDFHSPQSEGHIKIKFVNRGDKAFSINKGDAMAQGIVIEYLTAENEKVDRVRTGGFGSTDKK